MWPSGMGIANKTEEHKKDINARTCVEHLSEVQREVKRAKLLYTSLKKKRSICAAWTAGWDFFCFLWWGCNIISDWTSSFCLWFQRTNWLSPTILLLHPRKWWDLQLTTLLCISKRARSVWGRKRTSLYFSVMISWKRIERFCLITTKQWLLLWIQYLRRVPRST